MKKIKSDLVKNICLIISTIWLLILPISAHRFVRVRNMADFVAGREYILVGTTTVEYRALSSYIYNSKSKSQLIGNPTDTISNENNVVVWKLGQNGNFYTWQSVDKGKYLSFAKQGKADVALRPDAYGWQMSMSADGILSVSTNDGDAVRTIGLDAFYNYFGAYTSWSENGALLAFTRIYEQPDTPIDTTSNDTMPIVKPDTTISESDSDTTVTPIIVDTTTINPVDTVGNDSKNDEKTLYDSELPDTSLSYALVMPIGDKLFAVSSRMSRKHFLRSANITDFILADSTVALRDGRYHWRFRKRADGGLNLTDNDGVYYRVENKRKLSFLIQSYEPENFRWLLVGGKLYAQCDGEERLALTMNSDSAFALTSDSILSLRAVSLTALAPDSIIESDSAGYVVVAGGWSSFQLQRALGENTVSLDLTKIQLPLRGKNFSAKANPNAIIYVSAEMEEHVPDTWKNVVICHSDGGNYLKTNVVLCDRMPFGFARQFYIDRGQLAYSRSIRTSGWSSLVLPFAATAVPENIAAYTVNGITADNYLTLDSLSQIKAGQSFIFRSLNQKSSIDSVVFLSEAQTVPATNLKNNANILVGTAETLNFSGNDVRRYVLSNDGSAFVLPEDGSWLDPFRCYLQTTVASKSRSLHIRIGTNKAENSVDSDIFTTDGVLVSRTSRQSFLESSLPVGIYIMNHKKVMKKRR